MGVITAELDYSMKQILLSCRILDNEIQSNTIIITNNKIYK